jgi:hypothetical protein
MFHRRSIEQIIIDDPRAVPDSLRSEDPYVDLGRFPRGLDNLTSLNITCSKISPIKGKINFPVLTELKIDCREPGDFLDKITIVRLTKFCIIRPNDHVSTFLDANKNITDLEVSDAFEPNDLISIQTLQLTKYSCMPSPECTHDSDVWPMGHIDVIRQQPKLVELTLRADYRPWRKDHYLLPWLECFREIAALEFLEKLDIGGFEFSKLTEWENPLPNLKTVCVRAAYGPGTEELTNISMPALTKAEFHVKSMNFEQLLAINKNWPKVEELSLDVDIHHINDILYVLPMLRSLKVQCRSWPIYSGGPNPAYTAEIYNFHYAGESYKNLETFSLSYASRISIDFFDALPKLKRLYIDNEAEDGDLYKMCPVEMRTSYSITILRRLQNLRACRLGFYLYYNVEISDEVDLLKTLHDKMEMFHIEFRFPCCYGAPVILFRLFLALHNKMHVQLFTRDEVFVLCLSSRKISLLKHDVVRSYDAIAEALRQM